MSGVLVKFIIGWKGRLAKSRVDMCCGASGFLQWNSDTSLFEPLTSSASLHSSSLIPYPFQHTRYSNWPLNTWLSKICSTSYSSTLSQTTGGVGSLCTHSEMVSVL